MKIFNIIIIGIVPMLSGCGLSWFVPPNQQPISRDYASNWFESQMTHVFSTTPERRIVTVMPANGSTPTKFCAEPSPDVAQNLVDSLRLLAEATVKTESSENIQAKLQLFRDLTTNSVQLFRRSQGVQMFRDGMYNLCQSFQNGSITAEVFNKQYNDLLSKTWELTKLEIPTAKEQNIDAALTQSQELKSQAQAAAQRAETSRIAAEKILEDINKKIEELKAK